MVIDSMLRPISSVLTGGRRPIRRVKMALPWKCSDRAAMF